MSVDRRLPTLRSMEITRPGAEGSTTATTTPKRTRREREREEEEESEFYGLEGQSRLLRRAIDGDRTLIEGNSILARAAAERGKKREEGEGLDEVKENRACYTRRKLLVKDLPRTAASHSVDFLATYNKEDVDKASVATAKAWRRIARLGENMHKKCSCS